MIVISDSTPLITFMKLGRLDLLHKMFSDVLIPQAVFQELTVNELYSDEAEMIKSSDYIKVVSVQNTEHVMILQRATGLDRGESEAIVYADETKANLLLMDEAAGRKVAQNMNLPISGSIGVLIKAFKTGLLSVDEAEDVFDKLKKSNRHISEKLIQEALIIIRS